MQHDFSINHVRPNRIDGGFHTAAPVCTEHLLRIRVCLCLQFHHLQQNGISLNDFQTRIPSNVLDGFDSRRLIAAMEDAEPIVHDLPSLRPQPQYCPMQQQPGTDMSKTGRSSSSKEPTSFDRTSATDMGFLPYSFANQIEQQETRPCSGLNAQLQNNAWNDRMARHFSGMAVTDDQRILGPHYLLTAQEKQPANNDSRYQGQSRQVSLPPQYNKEDLVSHAPKFVLTMALPSDSRCLTVYQILLRQSLEYFSATQEDVDARVRGRKQKIRLGQIGVRCRYCAHLKTKHRGRGAVYFPKTLINVYQAAQNIASAHFCAEGTCCPFVPTSIIHEIDIQKPRRDASKAGRSYWVEACSNLGVYEKDGGLWLPGTGAYQEGATIDCDAARV